MDGRDFIQYVIRTFMDPESDKSVNSQDVTHHFAMNLPALAVTFLGTHW